jgi:F0F1-type ATP synthase assembly protein I
MAVISKVYKFEMISTIIFGLAFISCHRELNKVKQSYFERENGNTRTYANNLSISSNMMALIWIMAEGIMYLSLAVVYGSFTWYFCIPMMLLGLIAGVYLTQILTI